MKAVMAEMPIRWQRERANSEFAQWDEMWNGVLHMPPMPARKHQNLELRLAIFLFQNWVPKSNGRVNQQVNLTTPGDEPEWTKNYRIPDIVLLTPDRFGIDKEEYMAGAPLVVVEIRSPGDETNEKMAFYRDLGVPEVWVIDRDSCRSEISVLENGQYRLLAGNSEGWVRSPATNVEFRSLGSKQLAVRLADDLSSEELIPDR